MDSLKNLQDRGFLKQCSNIDALRDKLSQGPTTFYVGFDATADSLHIGHVVSLMAMAHLQKDGHLPICLLGGGTTMIGDPSGKTETRRIMPQEEIEANGKKLLEQFKNYIDFSGDKALLINNAKWLLPLNYIEFLRDIAKHFRVNEMIKARGYEMRMEREDGLSFLELNYQLLQAYDFLVLFREKGCELQMGGDDQWSNILAGVDLVRKVEQKPVFALTFPLLATASGQKMGKTESGALWLDPEKVSPYEFYQYWINVDDRDVEKFLKLFTFLPLEEIAEICTGDIREAKSKLAFEATVITHGEAEATKAMEASKSLFGSDAKNHENIPSVKIEAKLIESGISVVDLFHMAGLAGSKTASRKLIEQGGAYINDERVASAETVITEKDLTDGSLLLRQGKKNYMRVLIG
ncbi:MAG: tyrosine--tRNA ligase [Patescibacteria group bacterium]